MSATSTSAAAPAVTHHSVHVNGIDLHYVASGEQGSPVLLVHGFPETWQAFDEVIPLLARRHRVFAVDLRGFGRSGAADETFGSAVAAADLAALVESLGVGPVHLLGQDLSGPTTYRLAAVRGDLVRSWTAVETGLPGFGLEMLADVTHGGAWHIGVLAAPGVPEMLLVGRERPFIADSFIPSLTASADAVDHAQVDALVSAYEISGFAGAAGLYRSMLSEADDIKALAARPLEVPVLAVGGGSGDFTSASVGPAARDLSVASVDGVGHFVAMEAPDRLAGELLAFYERVEGRA